MTASATQPDPAVRRVRRAVPAFLATLALATGGLVTLTAAPATAAPNAPAIVAPADGSAVDSATAPASVNVDGTIAWAGTGSGGSVHVDNLAHPELSCAPIELPNDTDEAWSCDVGLALGANVIRVHGEDGEVGPASSITVWYGTTTGVMLLGPDEYTEYTEGDPVSYTGVGPAGGTVSVHWDDADTMPVLCTVAVPADGNWSCAGATPPGGESLVFATAVDMYGTASTDDVRMLYIAPVPPTTSYAMHPAGFTVTATTSVTPTLDVRLYPIETATPGAYDWGLIAGQCPVTAGTTSCTFANLAPGIWNVYTTASAGEVSDQKRDDFVRIPTAPTIAVAPEGSSGVRVTATAEGGTAVDIRDASSGQLACTIAGTGVAGSCLIKVAPGAHRYTAQARSAGFLADPGSGAEPVQASLDGLSAVVTSAAVAVAGAPAQRTPAPPAKAAVAPPVKNFAPTIETPSTVRPGSPVTVHGEVELDQDPEPSPEAEEALAAALAKLNVRVELHSEPVELGRTLLADDGSFEVLATIPLDTPPGVHHIVVTLAGEGIEPVEASQAVTIAAPAVSAEEPLADDGAGGAARDGVAPTFDRMQPAGANMLSALATLGGILSSPDVLIAAGVLALALLLLVALPSQLLDATLANSPGRLGRALRRLDGVRDRFDAGVHRVLRTPLALSAVAAVLLSLVYGFADPAFGFELSSLRMLLALAIAFLVISWGAGRLTGLIARRLWGVETEFEVQLSAIPLAVVGVVVSRLLDFSPGFFLGFAIGVQLLAAGRRARLGATVTSFAVILVLAVLAWVGYSALVGLAIDDFGGALARDTLSAIVVEGLTAAAIAVLPLTFLEGRELWETSKRAWLLVFLLVEFAFCLLVLPTAMEETEVADLIVWTIVLLAYAALAFAAWWWISRRPAAEPEAAEDHPRRQVDHPAG